MTPLRLALTSIAIILVAGYWFLERAMEISL